MESLLKLAALLEKYAPLIEKYLPLLEAQLKKVEEKKPPVEEEPIEPPKPEAVVFFSSQLNVMDVNGEAWDGVSAIGWGSYVRLDSNPKDQFGRPLPAAQLAEIESVEWRTTWDGEKAPEDVARPNVGGALYNKSNGLACSGKVFKEAEDAKRHAWAWYLRYNLKGGRVVETNEITFPVD